jgi:dihydropyrimidinase
MEARDRGLPAYAETCPQYLFLSEDDLRATPEDPFHGAKYVCTPPLRPHHHHEPLWRGLRNYDLQVVATDHCPFCVKGQKELGKDSFAKIPNGGPGLETRLPVVHDGGVRKHKLSLNRFVEVMSTTPAKLFGLFPRKGTIAVGSDADIVIFDPDETWTIRAAEHHSRIDYSLFEGREITGRVKKVFLRGRCIVDGQKWLGKEGMGQYLKRGASGTMI